MKISVEYSASEGPSVGVNHETHLVEIKLKSQTIKPSTARWLAEQLWLFAAEADGKHDAWSKKLKEEAFFG